MGPGAVIYVCGLSAIFAEPCGIDPVWGKFFRYQRTQRFLPLFGQKVVRAAQQHLHYSTVWKPPSVAQKLQSIPESMLPHQRSKLCANVIAISAEKLIRSLSIEHHLDSGFTRQAKNSVLRVDCGASKRLFLCL